MFIGYIKDAVPVAVDTAIPFIQSALTNGALAYEDGTIIIKQPGIYRIEGIVNLTNVAEGNIDVSICDDSIPFMDSFSTGMSTGITDFITLPISRTIVAKWAEDNDEYARLTVRLGTAGTVYNANITVTALQ